MTQTPPYERIVRLIEEVDRHLDDHESTCGDWVQFIALHPTDYEEFGVAELWGIPVVEFEDVTPKSMKVLCERIGSGVPDVQSVDEVLDAWRFGRKRPSRALS